MFIPFALLVGYLSLSSFPIDLISVLLCIHSLCASLSLCTSLSLSLCVSFSPSLFFSLSFFLFSFFFSFFLSRSLVFSLAHFFFFVYPFLPLRSQSGDDEAESTGLYVASLLRTVAGTYSVSVYVESSSTQTSFSNVPLVVVASLPSGSAASVMWTVHNGPYTCFLVVVTVTVPLVVVIIIFSLVYFCFLDYLMFFHHFACPFLFRAFYPSPFISLTLFGRRSDNHIVVECSFDCDALIIYLSSEFLTMFLRRCS